MLVPTEKAHFEKFAELVELFKLSATQDKFMGLTRDEMRAAIRTDPSLNNVGDLHQWDMAAGWLWYRLNLSAGTAVCIWKHLARYHFAGCQPVFVDIDDPSLTGDYPRKTEWN